MALHNKIVGMPESTPPSIKVSHQPPINNFLNMSTSADSKSTSPLPSSPNLDAPEDQSINKVLQLEAVSFFSWSKIEISIYLSGT